MCRTYRIPHSRFLGWDGTDQALALAHEAWLTEQAAATCTGCGTRFDEQVDDDTGRRLIEVGHVDCPVCADIAGARKDLGDQPGRHLTLRHADEPDLEPDPADDSPPPDPAARVVIVHEVTRERRAATLDEWRTDWSQSGWEVVFDDRTGNPVPAAASEPTDGDAGTVTA